MSKPKTEMQELQAEARTFDINPFHMSKAALRATIDRVRRDAAGTKHDPVAVARENLVERPPSSDSNPRAARPDTRDETGRRERVPLGDPRTKMAAPHRAGYVRRWLNDAGDRIHAAEAAGYQFVEDERQVDEGGRGTRRSMTVGTKEDGRPLIAYLMEIREEFYEADQAAKQSKLDEVDTAIKRGAPRGVKDQERDKFYQPDEGGSVRFDESTP